MIELKSAKELERMKKACRISAEALKVAQSALEVGVSTAYVDEKVRKYILSQGARPTFLHYGGFPKTACVSVNEELIHGIPSRSRIIKGIIKITLIMVSLLGKFILVIFNFSYQIIFS